MHKTVIIPNIFGEKIDALIEGNTTAITTVIFVHGFGTNKNEGSNYFLDVANALKETYRIVRFDFAGYGASEGKQEEVNYEKQTKDLEAIIIYVRQQFDGNIFLFAHSMGCLVTAMLSPNGIQKTVFSSIPNYNTNYLSNFFQNWISSKPGGTVDKNGVSMFPRSAGGVQKIGSSFWKILEDFDPMKAVSEFARKTKLLIIHAKQDPIIGTDFVKEYSDIPGVEDIWMDGDHNYTKKDDREIVIEKVKTFFAK